MSFLSSIVNVGRTILGGNNLVSNIAKTAALGYLLNRVSNSVTPTSQPEPQDRGARITVQPNTDYSIPVVYGDAFLEGTVTDAEITNNNKTMWYCLTLCEKTGVKLSTNQQSIIEFLEVYWDDNKVQFQSDGITVDKLVSPNDEVIEDYKGLIKFYPFSGSSSAPVNFKYYSNGNSNNAFNLFPNWNSSKQMNDLVFCLVRVDYNSLNNLTGLGKVEFKLSNNMKQPGDVLYDYMTNTRYGAGIDPAEIYSS